MEAGQFDALVRDLGDGSRGAVLCQGQSKFVGAVSGY